MRRFYLALLAIAVLSFSGSVSRAASEKIQIGLPVPNYGPYAPVFAAEELGLFSKNGVTVEITNYRGGATAQEALANGTADVIVFSPAGTAVAVEKGIREKIVAVGATAPMGWHLMVLPQSPIKTVKDLDGAKIGVSASGGATDLYATWIASQNGVHIQTIPVGPGGLIPTLKTKQVDAAMMHTPLPYELMLAGTGRSIFDLGKDMPPTIPDVWVVKQDLIDKDPSTVEHILRAIYQSVVYMQKHRDFSLAYLKKYTGEADDKLIAMEYDVVIASLPTSARIDRKWLEFSLALAKPGGAELPPIERIYTDRFASIGGE